MCDFILKRQQETKTDFYLTRELKLSSYLPKEGIKMDK